MTAKFCNECGALVDRRKGERRQADRRKTSAGAASRRLSALPSITPGQENAQGRSASLQAAETYLRKERPFRGPEQMPVEDARESGTPLRTAVVSRPPERPDTRVSGPSFLGLADSSPGNADYLLEEESHNGWRKWAVLLLLILIGVLVYMQWRTNWRAQPASPPPSQSAPPSSNQPQGSAAPASETTGVPPAQQASAQPQPTPAQPSADKEAAIPDKAKSEESAAADKSSDKNSDQSAANKDKDDGTAQEQSDQSGEQPSAQSEHKARAPIAEARKPAADRATDTRQDPMLLMARKYLYGQGVRRDCDQAMVYLRAANQKASAPARSQMGALYATGYCVPLDRVRAYQWFTSALNVEPENPSLQRERNNLWAQMSSNERQQAVK